MQNLESSTTTHTPNLNALLDGNLPSQVAQSQDNVTQNFHDNDVQTVLNAEVHNGFAELGLNAAILRSIEKSGYTTPTPIQAQAIPPAMAGRDLLLSAQTGSGKTAAFVLPILHKIAESKSKNRAVRALILTPTRELAYQVADSIRNYGAGLRDIFCVPLVGGAPYTGQIRALKKGVQIIVATPGRLLDHMNDNRIDLTNLSVLVLDEADRMLDMGFADDINRILQATPDERQTIMSSATWDGPVGKIAESFTKNPEKVSIKVESAHIDEKVYFCDDFNHKNKLLESLICEPDLQQAIIFTATKRSSEQLSERLQEWGHKACYLHGDLPQSKRNRILADVKAGKYSIVVATDVAARGIDVPAISHVFNYDLPRQVEDYVHRIGRSGRAGRTGIAINLCSRDDRSQFAQINRYLKREMTEATVEGLEPRFIESTYDRSRHNKSGRNGSRSNNGVRNGSRGTAGSRDSKYSGFKGDANKSSFSRDGARQEGYQKTGYQKEGFKKDGFKKDSYKKEGYQSEGYKARGERSAHAHRDHEGNGKMLTSHEFNFFNETRKREDRPARNHTTSADTHSRKPRHLQETHYNSANRTTKSFRNDDSRGEHSGEQKSKRFAVENSGTTGNRSFKNGSVKSQGFKNQGAKSHNSKGFEARQYETSRKRGDTTEGRSFDTSHKPHFTKSAGKSGDGQNAVKRTNRPAQRRDSSGKPV